MSLSIVLSSSRSPPPTDQQYSWSSSQHFDEDTYSTPPRNMKGLSGGRPAQLQLTSAASAHTCSQLRALPGPPPPPWGVPVPVLPPQPHGELPSGRPPPPLPEELHPLGVHGDARVRVGHRPLPLQQHLPPHALRQRPPGRRRGWR
ncbi:hypothetical protein NHX12_015413 [Muraenolepis orangiensis]|uniref:Uncharacterized protein n=1 Tax=Muraenolepis orangiensis TaxID=630683 RepID=A0A9Q0I534_9TELE|nr:hypothetical protein NHX12_015413 [Muraenolepis orangiensis]